MALHRGRFHPSPWGHSATSGDIFGRHHLEGAAGIAWVEARGLLNPLLKPPTAPCPARWVEGPVTCPTSTGLRNDPATSTPVTLTSLQVCPAVLVPEGPACLPPDPTLPARPGTALPGLGPPGVPWGGEGREGFRALLAPGTVRVGSGPDASFQKQTGQGSARITGGGGHSPSAPRRRWPPPSWPRRRWSAPTPSRCAGSPTAAPPPPARGTDR